MKKLVAITCMVGLGLVACGGPDGSAGTTTESATSCGAAGVEPESAAAAASGRIVSFTNEVLPVLVTSCSFGSCHGTPKGDNHGVFLGAKSGANDASAIRASLVGKASTQSPTTPYITPSDPSRSYLYRKLTGDFCGIPECDGEQCGRMMPRGGEKLDEATLETVRTWILQGATDS